MLRLRVIAGGVPLRIVVLGKLLRLQVFIGLRTPDVGLGVRMAVVAACSASRSNHCE